MKILILILSAVALIALVIGFKAMATSYEEPAYEVVEETDAYEVRRYAPYLVAETVVEGEFEDSGDRAFRRLFGYISGKNRGAEKIEMTSPVTSEPSGNSKPSKASKSGEKIAMTVPVTSTPNDSAAEDGYRYHFIMPAEYTLETLPTPEDPTVSIRQVPAKTVAVHRYSGRWTQERYREHEAKLLEALKAAGVTVTGEPVFARYNGPFTPWFLRRNEVQVEIADAS